MTGDTASQATSTGIPDTVARLRAVHDSDRTRSRSWRLEQLRGIVRMLAEREREFATALRVDLGREEVDAWLADLAPVAAEAKHAIKHLRSWMTPSSVPVPLSARPGKAWFEYEPLGVVLVIGPWNYPFYLSLTPLVAALAAGNCVVVKPSEHAPACSALLAELVPQYLDAEAVAVVEGSAEQTQQLLDQRLDHCFFTGGPEIGKLVMAGAARHLTPVTLELGGKSPVIVAADADLAVAARRVAWAKLLNSGQTCVAPDYVLVDSTVVTRFLRHLGQALDEFGGGRALPLVNARHAKRIAELVDGAGGHVVRGGRFDPETRHADLTVISNPDLSSDLMGEEIFGPVLPVLAVQSVDDAIAHVRRGTKPLAVYLFTESRTTERRVLDRISNGGTVVNHLVYHLLVNDLPFGGVGTSGMGTYHGKWGFETFSHRKSVLRKRSWPDPSLAYPPYTALKKRFLRFVF